MPKSDVGEVPDGPIAEVIQRSNLQLRARSAERGNDRMIQSVTATTTLTTVTSMLKG
jgi:hypothetical protein